MLKKAVRFFSILLFIYAVSVMPTLAANRLSPNVDNGLISLNLGDLTTALTSNTFSIKAGQPYDQANDPAFMKSGPADETPQHGYFAVPLIVIGLAGILVYFSRMKD